MARRLFRWRRFLAWRSWAWAWLAGGLLIGLSLFGFFTQKKPRLPGAVSPPPVSFEAGLPQSTNLETLVSESSPAETQAESRLIVPELEIETPITWEVDGFKEAVYLKALEQGVAHFRDTAKPGETGNIFLFGHSDYKKPLPNNYHRIFRNLDRLKLGDEIEIKIKETSYRYRVVSNRQVEPDDLSVLDATPTETVTLMTCWPPGTLDRRLIVQAERIL